MTVQEPPFHTPMAEAFVQAGVELGYKDQDYNGENQSSFRLTQATLRKGSRCSTSKAFIEPVSSRQNLHISVGARVLKVNNPLLILQVPQQKW